MTRTNFEKKQRIRQVSKVGLLLLIMALFFTFSMQAQVTIGLGEQSISGALLQLKDKEKVTDGGFNAIKGLALPRVELSDKNELYPMFLKTPTDPTSGPNDDYLANKATLDKTHIGLIVYNLTDNDEVCLGLNQWDGEKWTCFEQGTSTAKFDFDCSSLQVLGSYGDGVALNSSNYLKVTVTVTSIGSYSISAIADPDNGYFYDISGTFYSPGTFTITIPGTGQPVKHTQGTNILDPSDDTPDQFKLVLTRRVYIYNFIKPHMKYSYV